MIVNQLKKYSFQASDVYISSLCSVLKVKIRSNNLVPIININGYEANQKELLNSHHVWHGFKTLLITYWNHEIEWDWVRWLLHNLYLVAFSKDLKFKHILT